MKPLEPDVTLTDFALAAECFVFASILALTEQWNLPFQLAFIFLFSSSGVAALAGGLAHGFFPQRNLGIGRLLWRVSLLGIGTSALAIWSISAQLLFGRETGNYVTLVAGGAFLVYASLIFLRFPPFYWAVIFYIPAVIFMLVAFSYTYFSYGKLEFLYGLASSLLTLAAAVVQRANIYLHRRYFGHNALFHLIQALALFMIFLAAQRMIVY